MSLSKTELLARRIWATITGQPEADAGCSPADIKQIVALVEGFRDDSDEMLLAKQYIQRWRENEFEIGDDEAEIAGRIEGRK